MNSRARSGNLEKIYRFSNRISNSRDHMLIMLFIEQTRGTLVDKSRSSRMENLRTRLNRLSLRRREEIMSVYSNIQSRKPSPSSQRRKRRRRRRRQQQRPQVTESKSEESTPSESSRTRSPSPLPELKVIGVDIQPDKTIIDMAPSNTMDDESDESEDEDADIIYPDGVEDFRPYKLVARYRRANDKSTNFRDHPILVAEDSVETLVLGFDEFAHRHNCDLSFSGVEQRFNKSIYRAALGEIDLGSIHLLATDSMNTANFQFEINLDYDKDITKSEENVEQFVDDFRKAISDVLSCDNNCVRVFTIDKISKKSGKSHVNFGLTTPDPKKTDKLAKILQKQAKSGFESNTILKHVKQDEYDITWKPAITYLKIRSSDLNPRFNFDYRNWFLTEDTRGSRPYYFPIGWYRFGLNVNQKFEDGDQWLGCINASGEWPVAFHGTSAEAVTGIVQHGLSPSAVKVDAMRSEAIAKIGNEADQPGMYVATHCNGGADIYTRPFTVTTFPGKSEQFRIVFQCRVQPDKFTIHTSPVNEGEAWRVVDPKAIRPYGILLKKEDSSSLQ